MHVCMYLYVYIYIVNICMYVCIYMSYIYIYIYIYSNKRSILSHKSAQPYRSINILFKKIKRLFTYKKQTTKFVSRALLRVLSHQMMREHP